MHASDHPPVILTGPRNARLSPPTRLHFRSAGDQAANDPEGYELAQLCDYCGDDACPVAEILGGAQ